MDIDVKGLLYSAIEKMGKERVEGAIASEPDRVPDMIREICTNCVRSLDSASSYDKPKLYGDFAEALMHYLLTATMIPSERKVNYNSAEIDLVIPGVKQLQADPKQCILIFFPKVIDKTYLSTQLKRLGDIQPARSNIWIVLGYYDGMIEEYKDYNVFLLDKFAEKPFKPLSSIIDELRSFVSENKIQGFRILPS